MLDALNMTLAEIAMAGGIMCLAVAAQSAVGFGSALFAIPLLVAIGMPLPNVIILVATCSAFQAALGARELRRDVPWRTSGTAAAVMMVGFLVGLLGLKKLITLDVSYIKMTIGCVLCVLVFVLAVCQPTPVAKMHKTWAGLAFSIGGVLGGVCGMNGPPIVLWAMAHDWSSQKTRGFLFGVFSLINPLQICVLAISFDGSILWTVLLGLVFLPLIYLGMVIGLPIGNAMPKDTLRRIAYGVLILIGLSAAASAAMALMTG